MKKYLLAAALMFSLGSFALSSDTPGPEPDPSVLPEPPDIPPVPEPEVPDVPPVVIPEPPALPPGSR